MGRLLKKITSPQQLRKLTLEELNQLAAEIRTRIIEVVSRRGGHLASSLGAVEIIISLHYVFNTPYDKIVFDVGHQTYAHKILTGRNQEFEQIRQHGGISGFPSPLESEFDTFFTGHASNAISLALGLAEAKRCLGEKEKVIAVIGDGSLTGGECFEALNNAGHLKSDILVVFNHNEMSIAPSVGALSSYFNKLISWPVYNRFKNSLDNLIEKVPGFGRAIKSRLQKLEELAKAVFVPGIFFEELGFRYFGPLDGHNLKLLVETLRRISSLPGAKILHVVTKKGKGLRRAEENPEDFHSASRHLFQNKKSEVKKITYTDVFSHKLIELAGQNKKIVALTAAMPKGTGLDRFAQKYPQRFFDVGIAEQHLLSFASGLYRGGLRPLVAIYSTFLQRAYDQLIEDIALQKNGVVLAVDRAGVVGEDGPTHQGMFDISWARTIPNLAVVAPAYRQDLEAALEFAFSQNRPLLIRYPKDYVQERLPRASFGWARAEVIKKGEDIAILVLGTLLAEAEKALGRVEKEFGLSVWLVNMRFAQPLDEGLLEELAQKAKVIFTLEEGFLEGGFGSAILEFYQRRGILPKLIVERLGIDSQFVTFGPRAVILEKLGLNSEGIYRFVRKKIEALNYGKINFLS